MIARVVEQKGIVAVRRVDLGVADRAAIVEQRLDDFATEFSAIISRQLEGRD